MVISPSSSEAASAAAVITVNGVEYLAKDNAARSALRYNFFGGGLEYSTQYRKVDACAVYEEDNMFAGIVLNNLVIQGESPFVDIEEITDNYQNIRLVTSSEILRCEADYIHVGVIAVLPDSSSYKVSNLFVSFDADGLISVELL